MELLDGETLTARMERRRLDAAECCRLGRQIANVLSAAHAAGIIHRDLKPDNLFLVPDAEVVGGERVKVLDFGLAKLASAVRAADVQTRADLVVGTPSYMSPEQCRGGGSAIDHRADIYALGCILFKMIARRPPFVGSGPGGHRRTCTCRRRGCRSTPATRIQGSPRSSRGCSRSNQRRGRRR